VHSLTGVREIEHWARVEDDAIEDGATHTEIALGDLGLDFGETARGLLDKHLV
jgi:hypothetical protein